MKITVEIEVDDNDLLSGNYYYSPHRPEQRMSAEELSRWVLVPALEARLHALRSRMKWDEMKLQGSPNLRKRDLLRSTPVTDRQGRRHHAMLPTGETYPLRVAQPREGSQHCGCSPTNRCWYDNQPDPRWDFCVFCGDPHERK